MNNIILRYRLWERGEDSQRYSSFTSTPLKLVLYPTSFLSKHKIFKLKSKRYGTEKGTCKLCVIKVLWYWKKWADQTIVSPMVWGKFCQRLNINPLLKFQLRIYFLTLIFCNIHICTFYLDIFAIMFVYKHIKFKPFEIYLLVIHWSRTP